MNGYIAIDFNGTITGLKFGFPAVKEWSVAVATNPDAYMNGDEPTPLSIAKLMFSGYKNNCLLKDVQPSLTFEDFSDWVDEKVLGGDVEGIKMILETFNDSRYSKAMLEGIQKQNETAKKKIVKKSLKESKAS